MTIPNSVFIENFEYEDSPIDGHTNKQNEDDIEYVRIVTLVAAQERIEKLEKALQEIMDLEGELNTANYDDVDVCNLNNSFIEGYEIAKHALDGKDKQ